MRNEIIRRCCFVLLIGYGCWATVGQLWGQQGRSTSSRTSSRGTASRSTAARAPSASRSAGATRARTGGTGAYGPGIGEALVTSDPGTRRIMVVTDDETAQYISQVISNLDRPKPQVLIKVVFLELTHNNSSDVGVEGSWHRNFGGSWLTGLNRTNFTVVGSGPDNKIVPSGIVPLSTNATMLGSTYGLGSAIPSGAGFYQILGEDYQVTLRAIAQAGKLELLSRPSILARNNQQATISLGQQVPLVTNTRFDTFGNQINTVSYQSVGIILRVTPFITGDGLVEMIVTPEISSLAARTEWVPVSSGQGGQTAAPVINSRSADTVVVVPDGQTVVIGGLMQSQKEEGESKIPVLGDIPVLGNLFKSKHKGTVKTELIIFLTPKIVEEPRQLASMTSAEKANSPAVQSMMERDLSQFLDSLPVKGEMPPKKGRR